MSDITRSIFIAYPWNLYKDRDAYKSKYTDLERALNVKFLFAEERVSTGHILDKIVEMIDQTVFGIYDVSSWNANVTLEYGIGRGSGSKAFIAFNPKRTDLGDVPSDVRGYDRLQYRTLDELGDKVATLVTQELGTHATPDPLETDRQKVLRQIKDTPGRTARQLSTMMDFRLDYLQLLLRRSGSEVRTTGATRGVKYYRN